MSQLDTSPSSVTHQNVLNPGEVVRTSGKFAKPTKIPGKNYTKDEVVIRNADSGKGRNSLFNLLDLLAISIGIVKRNGRFCIVSCHFVHEFLVAAQFCLY